MQIIPAIDLIEGKVVRLMQGDFNQKTVYHDNPVEIAKSFEDAGITRLHLVDLDGAKNGNISNLKVLEDICNNTHLKVDFGGGIKTAASAKSVLNAGAHWITIGSMAISNKMEVLDWLHSFAKNKIIIGADVRNEMITVNGWQQNTNIPIIEFIQELIQDGFTEIFCTDVSKDGRLAGPSLTLYKKITTAFPELYFIASGGVSSLQDLVELKAVGCRAAIVGKAIYENRIPLESLQLI